MRSAFVKYMTETEQGLIVTALNSSAERWEEWARTLAVKSIAETFAKQAADARFLALQIAEG